MRYAWVLDLPTETGSYGILQHCPEPIDDDERELMVKEEDQYIVGRIKYDSIYRVFFSAL